MYACTIGHDIWFEDAANDEALLRDLLTKFGHEIAQMVDHKVFFKASPIVVHFAAIPDPSDDAIDIDDPDIQKAMFPDDTCPDDRGIGV